MNSDIVIRVEKLSKRYRYGGPAGLSTSLRSDITDWAKGLLQRGPKRRPTMHEVHEAHLDASPEYFWALKDVDLEARRGDVVGIIGRNGAGKSTLLKILSRITPPTSGRVTYYGRVSSLLEVGTGFHRELTGRENVFLNGSILGMKRSEIARKFDQIVAFAEIEKFIDTPVKFYSSGMYVRLAFAVAAHLESEIMIVDEVLSVGDYAFQQKCLSTMQDVTQKGRTVLFVSHAMETVLNLCKRCVLLVNGVAVTQGKPEEVVEAYMQTTKKGVQIKLAERKDRQGDGRLRFIDTWIEDDKGNRVRAVRTGQTLKIVALYKMREGETLKNLWVAFAIANQRGIKITDLGNVYTGDRFNGNVPRVGRVECVVPELSLNRGTYSYNVSADSAGSGTEDWVLQAGWFEVEGGDFYGTGRIPDTDRLVFMKHRWKLSPA